MKYGKFITLEGCEGVGKSTNLESIHQYLAAKGIQVVVSREPGGTPLAEEIRALILANRSEPVDALTELLLIFAARAQHLREVILPNLQAGRWVLCDRFTDATYAYQGSGRNLSQESIAELENLVQGTLRPDLTILLDIEVEEGLKRIGQRGELDRFESEQRQFFQAVRNAYLDRAAREPDRFVVINAAPALDQVQSSIEQHLEKFINECG